MSAYTAAIPLTQMIWILKKYYDVFLPKSLMGTMESVEKELSSFIALVQRLDSRSRKRMSASLEERAKQILEFKGVFASHTKKLLDGCYKENFNGDWDGDPLVLEDLKRGIQSLILALKKTKEEYCYCEEADSSSSAGNYKMVGLRDKYSEVKKLILCGENYVTSLVGMIGIGKTTLAREIFQDLDVVELCVCLAWVSVGKEFRSDEIIESILAQVDPRKHEIAKERNESTMVEWLKKSLEGKRTLIVLDDVWNANVIFFLDDLFATNKLVSVLLTSTRSYSSKAVYMRLLNEEESWDLLRLKVFGEQPCPRRLEVAAKEIANKCDGLPLTIVTVAHLLSEAGKTKESLWIEVATRKKHPLFTKAYDGIVKSLYPSYENIHREYYRLCFLYMGVFPIKYVMQISQINNLWVAEKLLPYFHEQEASSVRLLQHLAMYSLVMVYQRSTRLTPYNNEQRIKSWRLHSSWWHFCQREAARTNFFHVLECPADSSEEHLKGQIRLSVHNNVLFARKDVRNSLEENCASTARSLLCFGPYHQYQVPICFGLKLLRRLDALNIRFYEFPTEILDLVELTYLALTCNGKLPSSISKLVELQFLIVHQCVSIRSRRALTYLPTQILYMKKLEHLQVMGNDVLPYRGIIMLHNIATLLDVSAESCTTGVLVRNIS